MVVWSEFGEGPVDILLLEREEVVGETAGRSCGVSTGIGSTDG